ncbi:MAG: hypothetical protein CSA45_02150 [Gammaproteobacteria bacterium]|nr:MAG: hypothetical protein CSA45_02150 [Gammaproteobacteria bacterium]
MNVEYALILEDDEINAELIKTVIENMGYETQCYTSPVHAPLLKSINLTQKKESFSQKIALISAND